MCHVFLTEKLEKEPTTITGSSEPEQFGKSNNTIALICLSSKDNDAMGKIKLDQHLSQRRFLLRVPSPKQCTAIPILHKELEIYKSDGNINREISLIIKTLIK